MNTVWIVMLLEAAAAVAAAAATVHWVRRWSPTGQRPRFMTASRARRSIPHQRRC